MEKKIEKKYFVENLPRNQALQHGSEGRHANPRRHQNDTSLGTGGGGHAAVGAVHQDLKHYLLLQCFTKYYIAGNVLTSITVLRGCQPAPVMWYCIITLSSTRTCYCYL